MTAPSPSTPSDRALAAGTGAMAAFLALLWGGAALSARISNHSWPHGQLLTPFTALAHPGAPSLAWQKPVGPPALYWGSTLTLALLVGAAALLIYLRVSRSQTRHATDPRSRVGIASRHQVVMAAGKAALRRRAPTLRPSLTHPVATELGYRIGTARGLDCYTCVEDSTVLLGPPRAGKGLHLVIPMILDAPGPVITTSTRPDNLTASLQARQGAGPVAVFDPQHLAPGIPSATRWSPIHGCENPQTALIRAKALTAGAATGTTDANFWQTSAEQAVRCLLHAAALGGMTSLDLYRWSLSAIQARQAVMILASHPDAARAWHQALDAIVSADQKQRDSVWAMVGIAFAALADPRVLDAVSPAPGEEFDPANFLASHGTVYLLGTSTGAAATAGLVGAFVEDVVEAARHVAAASPAARLDPPLSLILDEAANYPLPSLTSLMSEGGGTGICPLVVLQSLAQARAVWGEHHADAIWDSAIVKLILGGGSNARDLDALSKLIGQRAQQLDSHSTGPDGKRSTSTTSRDVPIMEPADLRTLPFGTAVLLLRSAPPIVLTLKPWTERRDAASLARARADLEAIMQQAHAGGSAPGACMPGSAP